MIFRSTKYEFLQLIIEGPKNHMFQPLFLFPKNHNTSVMVMGSINYNFN